MKLKDTLVGFLMLLGILGFGAIVISIDSWPTWAVLILAVVVWVIYILTVVRDHRREIKYPVVRIRQEDTTARRTPQSIYDQKEDPR